MAKKQCSNCGIKVGVRTKLCPDCGHKFLIRKRGRRPKEVRDWEDLKKGDIIKVVTGSGPYFISKDRPGERIMMGHKGMFEVVELNYKSPKSCGIIGKKVNRNGYKANVIEYIYMGESFYDEPLSTHKEPHKILGVQTEAETISKKAKKPKKKKEESIDAEQLNQIISECDK